MTKLEFVDLQKQLEECFGGYSQLKRERIFHYCHDLSAEQFRSMVIYFIDNDKKPGVADFKAKVRAMPNENSDDKRSKAKPFSNIDPNNPGLKRYLKLMGVKTVQEAIREERNLVKIESSEDTEARLRKMERILAEGGDEWR